MSEKSPSIIEAVRKGKKTSLLQKINPFNWPGILIGKLLKTKDSVKAFKEKVVQDKASGKQLPWYADLYIMFHPFLELKAFRLRRKNQRDSFTEKIKQSIKTNNAKPLTFGEQIRYEFGRKIVPYIKSADVEARQEMRGHKDGKSGKDVR